MTHEEKVNYMKIAAGMVGYGFDKKGLDMLVSIYDLVLEKKAE
jgi:cystathionine beta-lyase family protein involved in aluminum resistance